jgi:TIR domain
MTDPTAVSIPKPPPDVFQRGEAYFRKLYPRSPTLNRRFNLCLEDGTVFKSFAVIEAHDPDRAVKQLMIAIPDLGSHGELHLLVQALFENQVTESGVHIGFGHADKTDTIWSTEMLDSPKTLIYTDVLHVHEDVVSQTFKQHGKLIGVLQESEMHSSLFISYGGPDSACADSINSYLNSHGVETWYFPDNALPGQKLHRVMSSGIMTYDRVLLICSKSSLVRPGVLNELERVLEREAREGGSDILIPVAIDTYVFSEWKPEREDIASQIRSRVITTVPNNDPTTIEFQNAMNKILQSLTKARV